MLIDTNLLYSLIDDLDEVNNSIVNLQEAIENSDTEKSLELLKHYQEILEDALDNISDIQRDIEKNHCPTKRGFYECA